MKPLLLLLFLVLASAWPGAAGAERISGSSRSHAELLERVTAFSLAYSDRLYYSLSDFIAEGLKDLCSGP